MKNLPKLSSYLLCFVTLITFGLAHQPHLVGKEKIINIQKPEISQAFYARLNGTPVIYKLTSKDNFMLYVNILVPDVKGIKKDISARVYGNSRLITNLNGKKAKWKRFYEEYSGDHYFSGPVLRKEVPPGKYEIVVYSPKNVGKYVLAVGEKESFSPGSILNTLIQLPKLKVYFGKSPYTAFNNKIGLYLLPMLAVLLIAVILGIIWGRKIMGKRLAKPEPINSTTTN